VRAFAGEEVEAEGSTDFSVAWSEGISGLGVWKSMKRRWKFSSGKGDLTLLGVTWMISFRR